MMLLLPQDYTKHLMPIGFIPGDAEFGDLVKLRSCLPDSSLPRSPTPFAFDK